MRQADLLPPLEELFRLSFFGSVASKAYTAAGAFVEYLRERSGPEALRRWYAGEGLQDVTGTEASILEQEFLAYLHATEVPEEVAVLASVRFSRPGVFQRRCPHAVDRKIRGASDACGAQPDKARRLIAEAVRLDPVRAGEEVWLPHCAWLSGNEKEAGEQYEKIVADQERYAPHELRAAWESLGDLRWNQGQIPKAKKAYEAALKVPQGQDARRQSEVKLWGLSQAGLPGEALRTTLAPRPDQQELAVLKLAEWQSKGPQSAFATYLLSRGALFEGRSDEALRLASQFQPGALPLASVQKEGGRTKVLIACLHAMRTGNDEPLKSWIKEYEATKPSAIGLSELSRLTERCLTPEAMK
jgi:tetratricopeptide (TPR) repeat protein